MIKLQHVTRFYGHQDVFRDCDLYVGPSDRIGLVGPNGTGKTTLLRLILQEQQPNSGEITRPKDLRIGYLPQRLIDLEGRTVLGLVMDAAEDLGQIQRELHETTRSLEGAACNDEVIRLTERQGRLHEVFDHMGGYELEARAKGILLGLGFDEGGFQRPVEQFSGGWMMRASMARILLSDPDLILLDEPTNHLDLESLIWLEDYLKNCSSALVVVSHDRVFLNNIVNRIVEIDESKLISYGGNYDFYEKEKEKRLKVRQAAYENQQERIRQIERFIERNRVRKDRARQVQSRIKLLERMERIEPPLRRRQTLEFRFPPPSRAPKTLIELRDVSKSFNTRRIYERTDLSIQRGDRIAVLGPNGVGKTTLMKILRNDVAFEGERREAVGVCMGVFSQEEIDRLMPDRTVFQELLSVAGNQPQGSLRGLLGTFLFSGDDVFKRVSVLSGGEKTRLLLCKILVQPANLLLLDEPTNHLDIPSREILERALCQYRGTFCIITHDRHLINAVANKVFAIRNQKVEIYPGNFDDFKSIWEIRQSRSVASGEGSSLPGKRIATKKARVQKRAEAEWRQRFSRAVSPLRKHLATLEKRIEENTAHVDEITSQLAREETYQNPQRLRELSETYRSAKAEVEKWTQQWEAAVLELEEVEKRFEETRPNPNYS